MAVKSVFAVVLAAGVRTAVANVADVENSTAFIDNRDVHNKGAVLETNLGNNFVFTILDVDNLVPGGTPVVTYQVADAEGNLYDVLNDPEFASANGARIRAYYAWTTDDFYNGDELGNLVNGGRAPGDDHDVIVESAAANGESDSSRISRSSRPAPTWVFRPTRLPANAG